MWTAVPLEVHRPECVPGAGEGARVGVGDRFRRRRGWPCRFTAGGRGPVRPRADQVPEDQLEEPFLGLEEGAVQFDHADLAGDPLAGLGVFEPGDEGDPFRCARTLFDPAAEVEVRLDHVAGLEAGGRVEVLALAEGDLFFQFLPVLPLDDRELAPGGFGDEVGDQHFGKASAQALELGATADVEEFDGDRLARVGAPIARVDVGSLRPVLRRPAGFLPALLLLARLLELLQGQRQRPVLAGAGGDCRREEAP
jgi:hypothetical protein